MASRQKRTAGETKLTASDRAIIREETELLDQVLESIRAELANGHGDNGRGSENLRRLRDATASARPGDMPTMLNELHRARALENRSRPDALPDPLCPYFAHLRIRENGRSRDLFLGKNTFLCPQTRVRIIDWRNAPLSRIFYQYREGDDFVEQLPGRIAEGTVEARRVVTIHDGRLVRVVTPHRTLVHEDGDRWAAHDRSKAPVLQGGAGSAERGKGLGTGQSGTRLPDVTALLDQTQFDILAESGGGPLLVLGSAGSGKTTVALHRLARLNYDDPEQYAAQRMAVMVPEGGLARWIERLLQSLDVERTPVITFAKWIREQATRQVKDLPQRIHPETPSTVSRFKRHPALWHALPGLVDKQTRDMADRMRGLFPDGEADLDWLGGDGGTPLSVVEAFKSWAAQNVSRSDAELVTAVREAVSWEKGRLTRPLSGLHEALCDREFLRAVIESSGGALDPSMIETIVAHTARQMGETAESRYADVDADRLETLDGQSLDYGTPEEIAGTRDAEDDALCLELLRLGTGALKKGGKGMPVFGHLVLDEAQELAPIELSLVGRSMDRNKSVTVAGDAAQQISEGSVFAGWDGLLKNMGVRDAGQFTLEVNYRSTQQIADFGHRLLGPIAPAEMPRSDREGAPVERFAFSTEGPAAVFLTESITDLMQREPNASCAVICRNTESAETVAALIGNLPRVRLIRDGEFPFTPGIDITDVHQVKGLEFDYVIVPDANADLYPMQPESRRLLHVAATRAVHQLWIMSVGHPSPVLPAGGRG